MREGALELGAAQRDQRVVLELQLGPDHRHLERRLARRVADHRVGQRERDRVHRAARAQAEVLVAVAAGVLHRGEQARAQDAHAHWCSTIQELGARDRPEAHPVARARTGSAAARAASNTASGVRPMTLQPPEIAYG